MHKEISASSGATMSSALAALSGMDVATKIGRHSAVEQYRQSRDALIKLTESASLASAARFKVDLGRDVLRSLDDISALKAGAVPSYRHDLLVNYQLETRSAAAFAGASIAAAVTSKSSNSEIIGSAAAVNREIGKSLSGYVAAYDPLWMSAVRSSAFESAGKHASTSALASYFANQQPAFTSSLNMAVDKSGVLSNIGKLAGASALAAAVTSVSREHDAAWRSVLERSGALISSKASVGLRADLVAQRSALLGAAFAKAAAPSIDTMRSLGMLATVANYAAVLPPQPRDVERSIVSLGAWTAYGQLAVQIDDGAVIADEESHGLGQSWSQVTAVELWDDTDVWIGDEVRRWQRHHPVAAEELRGALESLDDRYAAPTKVATCLIQGLDTLLEFLAPDDQVKALVARIAEDDEAFHPDDAMLNERGRVTFYGRLYTLAADGPSSAEISRKLTSGYARSLVDLRNEIQGIKHGHRKVSTHVMRQHLTSLVSLVGTVLLQREHG